MAADRLLSVIGLGFGDCGKGLCTDHLVRRFRAHTVVRYNGGAQAGHNVVLPDGRHHTFSQFGCGTFSPGVFTVLSHPVIVHPTALLEEGVALERIGIVDAFERLLVDPRCRVTTPFHQAVGRLRELDRAGAAHGSCGAGFGETVDHALQHPDETLHWSDLAEPARAAAKLEAIRGRMRDVAAPWKQTETSRSTAAASEWQLMESVAVAQRWLARACAAHARTPASIDAVLRRMAQPGTIVFEGAQGALLDETHGFHPHTTWSSVGTTAVENVAAEAGLPSQVEHIGVLRTYLTRHGAGPMPTEDPDLDAFAELHNGSGWQGRFRRGHVDQVLLRYALDTIGTLRAIALTHTDVVGGTTPVRWCTSYRVEPALVDASVCERAADDPGHVLRLQASREGDLVRAARLTRLLRAARPIYDACRPASLGDYVERLSAVTGLPMAMTASGPTHADVVSSMV